MRRYVVAVAMTVVAFLLNPILSALVRPLHAWDSIPVIGWVAGGIVTALPLAISIALSLVIWITALKLWRRILVGLPGFRSGFSAEDWKSLSRHERKIARELIANGRRIMVNAGLTKKDAAGTIWAPRVSNVKLTPAGVQFSAGGVAMIPGADIERAVDSIAAAVPGPESVEVVPSGDVRYATFVVRTRDPYANLDSVTFGDAPVETGTLDDFLGMGEANDD